MAKLKLFAGLREAAGVSEVQIEATTLEELVSRASSMYGANFSAQLDRATIALNGQGVAKDDLSNTSIEVGDEVAFLPPVSGGLGLMQ